MEERDGRQVDRMLLTREEEASLRLLKPLFTRHLDLSRMLNNHFGPAKFRRPHGLD